MEYAVGKQLPD